MPSPSKPAVAPPAGDPPVDLVVDDLEVGTGDEVAAGAQVDVHYVGVAWSTGEQFDARGIEARPSSSNSAAAR